MNEIVRNIKESCKEEDGEFFCSLETNNESVSQQYANILVIRLESKITEVVERDSEHRMRVCFYGIRLKSPIMEDK